eukprot:996110-Alexandrium_andersonii.AAC.1
MFFYKGFGRLELGRSGKYVVYMGFAARDPRRPGTPGFRRFPAGHRPPERVPAGSGKSGKS